MKKRLKHSYFSVNIAKFLRTPILKNICKQLLLFVSLHRPPITKLSLCSITGLYQMRDRSAAKEPWSSNFF